MDKDFIFKLEQILDPSQILANEPMSQHTSFQVGGPADLYLLPKRNQVAQIIRICKEHYVSWQIIGNGSNLLVTDKGIRGVVIEVGSNIDGMHCEGSKVIVGAGTTLACCAAYAMEHHLTGMEFASGIPGSIGGAVTMNAGAYGGEMKDIIDRAIVLDQAGVEHDLTLEELELGYRQSVVAREEQVVLEATLKLELGEYDQIKVTMEDLKQRRASKQPLEYPSAGSTFKRPKGYFAGQLIMDAGLRGYRVGGAQVSQKHCGFVINVDHATSADVQQVIADVRAQVYEKFQVKLEPEVKFIGEL